MCANRWLAADGVQADAPLRHLACDNYWVALVGAARREPVAPLAQSMGRGIRDEDRYLGRFLTPVHVQSVMEAAAHALRTVSACTSLQVAFMTFCARIRIAG